MTWAKNNTAKNSALPHYEDAIQADFEPRNITDFILKHQAELNAKGKSGYCTLDEKTPACIKVCFLIPVVHTNQNLNLPLILKQLSYPVPPRHHWWCHQAIFESPTRLLWQFIVNIILAGGEEVIGLFRK